MSDTQIPRAPTGLGLAGKRLWRAVHAEFDGFNPGELFLLEHAARTVDLVDQLAAAIATEGAQAIGSTGQPVTHPLLVELRLQRKLAADLLRQLGLPDLDELPNRNPPRRRNL